MSAGMRSAVGISQTLRRLGVAVKNEEIVPCTMALSSMVGLFPSSPAVVTRLPAVTKAALLAELPRCSQRLHSLLCAHISKGNSSSTENNNSNTSTSTTTSTSTLSSVPNSPTFSQLSSHGVLAFLLEESTLRQIMQVNALTALTQLTEEGLASCDSTRVAAAFVVNFGEGGRKNQTFVDFYVQMNPVHDLLVGDGQSNQRLEEGGKIEILARGAAAKQFRQRDIVATLKTVEGDRIVGSPIHSLYLLKKSNNKEGPAVLQVARSQAACTMKDDVEHLMEQLNMKVSENDVLTMTDESTWEEAFLIGVDIGVMPVKEILIKTNQGNVTKTIVLPSTTKGKQLLDLWNKKQHDNAAHSCKDC